MSKPPFCNVKTKMQISCMVAETPKIVFLMSCSNSGYDIIHSQPHIEATPTPSTFEPHHEKTNILGFRPCPTQTGLHGHRRVLKA